MPSHLDGDGFYRLLFPGRELNRQHGWRCSVAPHVTEDVGGGRTVSHFGVFARDGDRLRCVRFIEDWLLEEPFDILVMQQRGEPCWPGLYEKLRGQGKTVVVDTDDAWLGLPSWNPGSRKPRVEVEAMLAQIGAADALTCATPALAEMYREWQPNSRVIRNRLDWRMWADAEPAYEVQRRRLRVGWMGELRWRRGDLEVLRGVLGPWLEQHPNVDFVAAGDPRVHDVLGVPVGQRVSTNRVRFGQMDLADITATFDVGLVPLDLRDPKARSLNECKSHLKGLEYNACGIPFIASPSESYRWWADGNGLLASNPGEWRRHLDTLLDPWERRELGTVGRFNAQFHSIQNGGVDEWADWLRSCVDANAAVAGVAA